MTRASTMCIIGVTCRWFLASRFAPCRSRKHATARLPGISIFTASSLLICSSQRHHAGCSAFWYITRTLYCMQNTVKPLMLTYPLFREFCEPNKTVKLKGANIDYTATLIDNLGVDKWWLTQSLNHQMQYFTRVLLLVMHTIWLKSITH